MNVKEYDKAINIINLYKRCSKCANIYPKNDTYFYTTNGVYRGVCKTCMIKQAIAKKKTA